jgi:hypothetical protein
LAAETIADSMRIISPSVHPFEGMRVIINVFDACVVLVHLLHFDPIISQGVLMKRLSGIIMAAAIALVAMSGSQSLASEKEINWKQVSKNLVRSLASDNEGLRQSAMAFFVEHADKLDINESVYDVMRIYRNHPNLRVRKLALVTLYKMQNKWAMEFLKVDLRFQDEQELKNMVAAIVLEYQAKKKTS